jgi:hypothetical protein
VSLPAFVLQVASMAYDPPPCGTGGQVWLCLCCCVAAFSAVGLYLHAGADDGGCAGQPCQVHVVGRSNLAEATCPLDTTVPSGGPRLRPVVGG